MFKLFSTLFCGRERDWGYLNILCASTKVWARQGHPSQHCQVETSHHCLLHIHHDTTRIITNASNAIKIIFRLTFMIDIIIQNIIISIGIIIISIIECIIIIIRFC